ncbi:putative prolyl 4-hydroxylase 3 [Dorcoceras hygrometricum]|uniref:procollagen-proline 4-dioxygenase n=1 Tax=Dorcoceras hygrometricum TaxID=472368 RepID=A0A2Z7BY80_9LAMI|nr:putative prolyl 4-hydroxylase 3 [Dorcoceras hygrometricum]
MAKGRGSRHQGKRSSTVVLVLSMLLMLSVVLLMLLGLGIFSLPIGADKDSPLVVADRIKFKRVTIEINKITICRYLIMYWQSKEECEYLINLARPHMKKSTVVDSKTGKSKDSRVRTSSGMFLRRGQDKIIRTIEKRIADYTFIPAEHGEGLQVLHYEVGQKYEPHYDYFLDEFNTKNGGQRIATVLMYLSDVEDGGETIFPAAKGNFSAVPGWSEMSECAQRGLAVKPKMGDALLFWRFFVEPKISIQTYRTAVYYCLTSLTLEVSAWGVSYLFLAFELIAEKQGMHQNKKFGIAVWTSGGGGVVQTKHEKWSPESYCVSACVFKTESSAVGT